MFIYQMHSLLLLWLILFDALSPHLYNSYTEKGMEPCKVVMPRTQSCQETIYLAGLFLCSLQEINSIIHKTITNPKIIVYCLGL